MPKRKGTRLRLEHHAGFVVPEFDANARPPKRPVWKLNADDNILSTIEFDTAVSNIISNKAHIVEPWGSIPGHFVQGPVTPDGGRFKIPWPIAVRQNKYVYVEWGKTAPPSDGLAARMAVLKRDKFKCQYMTWIGNQYIGCENAAHTIDHIVPQSKGGQNTWLNLVAACQPCNGYKRDRTPEEAGMRLKHEPYVPELDRYAKEQKEVWKLLEKGRVSVQND